MKIIESLLLKKSFLKKQFDIVNLNGPDASEYLHRQTTNKVVGLGNEVFNWNTFITLGGKIESYFITICEDTNLINLLVDSEMTDLVVERIKKFQIIEEFEVNVEKNIELYFHLGLEALSFGERSGQLFNLPANISFEPRDNYDELTEQEELFLSVLSTQNLLGSKLKNQLLVNTHLSDIGLNLNKGCFPGQEAISKLINNRGASKFPCLAFRDEATDDTIELDNQFFCCFQAKREERVFGTEVDIDGLLFKVSKTIIEKRSLRQLTEILYLKSTQLFIESENSTESEALLKLIISSDPTYEDAIESLAVIYGRDERFKEAIALFNSLLDLNSESILANTNLSLYHMKLGNIETAETFKEQATTLEFALKGQEYDQKKIKEEQIKQRVSRIQMFKDVLSLDSKDEFAIVGLSQIYIEDKMFKEAQALLSEIVDESKSPQVFYQYLYSKKQSKQSLPVDLIEKAIVLSKSKGDIDLANKIASLN